MLRRFMIALLLAVIAWPVPAAGEERTPETLRVVSVSPWIDPERPFRAQVRITNTTERALRRVSLRVVFYDRVLSRSQLRRSIDERPQTRQIATVPAADPGSIPPGEQRLITIERAGADIAPALSRSGVFPIEIVLDHSRGSETERTAIPSVGSAPSARLNATWVQPLTRPAAIRPDNIYPSAAVQALAADEIAQHLRIITERPAARVAIAPSGLLVDTLEDLADGFTRRDPERDPTAQPTGSPDAADAREALEALGAVAPAVETLSTTYAPTDLPALARHGPQADALRQIALGRSAGSAHVEPPAQIFVPAGLSVDTVAASALEAAGVRALVLDPASLGEQPSGPFEPQLFGPSRAVRVRARGARFTALLADPALRARFAGPQRGVLLAQSVIAETASAWLELPVLAAERTIVIAPDTLPSPTALAAALDGLSAAPWIRMRTPSEVLRDLPPQDANPLPLFRADPTETDPMLASVAARDALGVLSAIVIEDAPELERLERLVLASQSVEWAADPDTGTALARGTVALVDQRLRSIRVQPRQVTLTSRASRVPVTLINGSGATIRVRIRMDSAKVAFPGGDRRTVEVPSPDGTFDFEIEALGTGSFPLDVRVETPDGTRLIARGRFTIRSTRVSAVTLAATGGSALFLLLAWLRRSTRRRGARAAG